MNTSYDAIIIGSGAGGSAAAYSLATQGRSVLIVEKGPDLPHDGSTLDIQQVVHEGRFKSKERWSDGRGRELMPEEYFNVGGKTKWYGAALLRYSPQEFEAEAAHQCLGWPLRHEELRPYYDQAERLLRVRTFDCEPDLKTITDRMQRGGGGWRAEPLPLGLDQNILLDQHEAMHFDGFASAARLKADAETAFLARVRAMPNVTLLTSNTVTGLLCDPDDMSHIIGVRLQDGRSFMGRSILLAAGALHSPRILQSHLDSAGLSRLPAYNQIGRNLKLHLLTAMVAVSPTRKSDLIRKTTLILNDRLPHSSVQPLGFDSELIGTLIPRIVPPFIAAQIGRRAYGFFLQTEDGSHPDNRVRVAQDAKGEHRPMLDYCEERLAPALNEHKRLISRLRAALAGAGMLAFSKRIGIEGTAHACGTLAAGTDPASSVTDATGQVHGMKSLYVVDGSILPRSSRVNPSLTIYAWSLRVADHIGVQLAVGSTASRELESIQ